MCVYMYENSMYAMILSVCRYILHMPLKMLHKLFHIIKWSWKHLVFFAN